MARSGLRCGGRGQLTDTRQGELGGRNMTPESNLRGKQGCVCPGQALEKQSELPTKQLQALWGLEQRV